ncbi:hypothetical protein [Staphylococcus chromogenes]|uniref:hypothetical protein n=1 Tax=Staphylococcus chromogenes TaxID=46126 RepID=UPI001E59EEEF|nr:hypothetical protein [Staphylococcus chromogenes]MCD9070636.1 hypothetical protein [Staphylococcus chromogenes]
MGVPMYEYVVYKGDEVICAGTKDEVAKKLAISKDNLDLMANNVTKKREADAYERNGYSKRMVAVKVRVAELQKELGLA